MSEYIVDFPSNEINDLVIHERLVRCKDCKYSDISYEHAAVTGELHCYGYLVENWDWYNDEPSDGRMVEPDGFCKWGERRTND